MPKQTQSSKPKTLDTASSQSMENNQTGEKNSFQAVNQAFDSDADLSSLAESTILSASGYQISDEVLESDGPRLSDIKFDRTVSVPADPESVRQAMPGCHEDSAGSSGQTPRGIAMKKRSQSACKTQSLIMFKRPLYGVSPHCKFGPKGYLSSASSHHMSIPDPSDQRLHWTKPPLSVLIIRKHLDSSVLLPFRDLVIWLVEEKSMLVYVEQKALEESHLLEDKDFEKVQHKLKPFKQDVDDLTDKVDFIICLGGDGTLLYVSSLFQGSVPPVMAFNMGSLGFLTPFQFSQDFKQEVSRVMQGSAPLLLRYRLKCVVMKHETGETNRNVPHVKNIQKEHKLLKTHKLVLNEVVLDRGPSSYLSNLDLYIEGRRVTTVQGDGLIISTPTGSTAYAVSAGASMIHPSVPCILLTPICPHSLSFRPIVVPAGVEIKLMLNPNSRGTAMVSFDGRDRQEIHQGDSLRITTAAYPVPSICGGDQIEDWFDGLAVCLNWNIRAQQRPLQRNPSLTSIDSMDSATDLLNTSNGYLSSSNSGNRTDRTTPSTGAEDKNSNNSGGNGRGGSAGEKKNSGKSDGKTSGHARKPSSH